MTELREKPNFERVYAEYKEKVARYVRGKIANIHDAEDIVSNVFVKVLNGLNGFDEKKASLSTWIYTITRNTVADHFRTTKRFCELTEEIPDGQSADEKLLNEETLARLADALSQLGERERDIIILHYYSSRALKETAQMMSISYSYIKLLHSNALKTLRKIIDE